MSAESTTFKFDLTGEEMQIAFHLAESLAEEYDPSETYLAHQAIVTYQAKFYFCVRTTQGGDFNSLDWVECNFFEGLEEWIGNGLNELFITDIAPAYDSSAGYTAGEVVLENGRLYICNENISQPAGDFDESKWTQISLGELIGQLKIDKDDVVTLDTIFPEFSTSINYAVGDLVSYEGGLYKCTTAHSAGDWVDGDFTATTLVAELNAKQKELTTSSVPSGTINEAIGFDSNGDLVRGSGGGGSSTAILEKFAPAYDENEEYFEGNVVCYNGSFYQCIADTTGTFDSNNWNEINYQEVIEYAMKMLANGFIAADYNENGSYAVGDYALSPNFELVRCISATTGEYNGNDWEVTNVATELTAMNTKLSEILTQSGRM